MYDITDEKSFENIQNWMKSIKEVRERDFVLCLNKYSDVVTMDVGFFFFLSGNTAIT